MSAPRTNPTRTAVVATARATTNVRFIGVGHLDRRGYPALSAQRSALVEADISVPAPDDLLFFAYLFRCDPGAGALRFGLFVASVTLCLDSPVTRCKPQGFLDLAGGRCTSLLRFGSPEDAHGS